MNDNRRDSLEAHAGVDAFLGERGSHARLVAVPGDEDQVPDLEKAIAVLAVRPAVRPPAAVLLAPVVVDLGAGSAPQEFPSSSRFRNSRRRRCGSPPRAVPCRGATPWSRTRRHTESPSP